MHPLRLALLLRRWHRPLFVQLVQLLVRHPRPYYQLLFLLHLWLLLLLFMGGTPAETVRPKMANIRTGLVGLMAILIWIHNFLAMVVPLRAL